ncbi:MAG: hypothetical protein KC620_14535, partial [Myxococcales bacterium]|nr:hypothetical protein [Myxococcales bacterium]
VDGQPLAGPIEWLLYADRPECTGRPDARAAGEAPLHLDRTEGEIIVRVVAARGGRQGAPSPPFALRWTPPPPPPEAPLAFADGRAQVVVNWLPPDAPTVRVLRDGAVVAEVAAAEAGFTDAPPPGRHRYAIEAQGPDFRTAASPETAVTVP